MPIVLLALGILTAGTGAVMIGFGVPINEFSLGNTLIISGTTALVGGLVVIGLAVASRHLMLIATLLKSQPVSRPARPSEGFDPASGPANPGPARMPFPPKFPPDGTRDMPPPPQGRFAPPETPSDPIFERLRMNPPSAQRGETPMLSDEEAPLSPRAPRIPLPADTSAEEHAGARGEFRLPPKSVSPGEPEKSRNGMGSPQSQRSPFNETWPDAAPSRAEPGDSFARASDARPNGDALRSALAREVESIPVSILKSGVVDGMAYTLYTDGSIEAELAHGVVRFGSIEELRNHLEKGA